MFQNYNLVDITTPIDGHAFRTCMEEANYDKEKSDFLFKGFTQGFDFGYRRPVDRRDTSDNIPLKLGSKNDLWNKIMKEVALGRYAGPFVNPPYQQFIQSPVGLVPKAGGNTRLIFHLSYDFGKQTRQKSFNFHMPQHMCSVKYQDLDHAVDNCIKLMKDNPDCTLFFAKTDFLAAFRQVPG